MCGFSGSKDTPHERMDNSPWLNGCIGSQYFGESMSPPHRGKWIGAAA